MYFLDDAYLQPSTLSWDIAQFVNGFKVEQLELKKWAGHKPLPNLAPTPISWKYRVQKRRILFAYFAALFIDFMSFLAIGPNGNFVLVCFYSLILLLLVRRFLRSRARFSEAIKEFMDEAKWRKDKVEQLINEYNAPRDLPRFMKSVSQLDRVVADFKGLPKVYKQMKENKEEQVYNEELKHYLANFRIDDHEIASIGSARKEALLNSGIRTAADISLLHTVKVPGIGPKYQQVLFSWQRQKESGFTYIPDPAKIAVGMALVDDELAKLKLRLESNIRREYQSLTLFKENINSRAVALEGQINDAYISARQAEIDLKAFRKFAII
jgi:hypothetical protein